VLLVVDAAYADYVRLDDYEPGSGLAGDNVVMSRTFSKIFALAAMRIGWVHAPPHVIEVLARIEPSFPLTAPALAAAIAALDDHGHRMRARRHNDQWLPRFGARLEALGLTVYPSQANFVTVRFPGPGEGGAAAADAHLLSRGIIARRFVAPAFADCLRITIGMADDMRATGDALAELLHK